TRHQWIAQLETRAKGEQECVDMLDAAFKQDPNTAKLVYQGKSGQAIYDACTATLTAVTEQHDKLYKLEQDAAEVRIGKVYKDKWPKAEQFYASAKKKLGKGDDFAILNANTDIRTAFDQYDSVRAACDEVLRLHIDAFQLDKATTVGALCEKAGATLGEVKTAVADIQKKYDTAYDHVQAKIFAAVHGDRARIMKQEGLPSWFDGADLLDSHQWFNAMLRSSYYRYDSSTGCQTT